MNPLLSDLVYSMVIEQFLIVAIWINTYKINKIHFISCLLLLVQILSWFKYFFN